MPFPNTKRLTFRRFTKDDLNLLLQLDTDPEVMKFITLGKPRSKSEICLKFLPRILNSYNHGEHFGIIAAFLKKDNSFI